MIDIKTIDDNITEAELVISALQQKIKEYEQDIKNKTQNLAALKKTKRKDISSNLIQNKGILELFLKHEEMCNDTFTLQNGFRPGYKIPKCAKCALHFLTQNDLQNVDFSFTLRIVKDTA